MCTAAGRLCAACRWPPPGCMYMHCAERFALAMRALCRLQAAVLSLVQCPGPSEGAVRLAAALWPPDSSSGCARSQHALQLAMAEPERPALVAISLRQCTKPYPAGSRPGRGLWQLLHHPSSAHAAHTSGRPAAGRVLQLSVPGSHNSCHQRMNSLRSGSRQLHPAVLGGLSPPGGAAAPTCSWQAAQLWGCCGSLWNDCITHR